MKKILLGSLVAVLVLAVAAIFAVGLFLDRGIKAGVETFGPKLTQTPVTLEEVKLSVLSGGGSMRGLVIGNPAGYKAPQAIRLGYASLSLQPSSLFSDKVVVRSIQVQAPELTFEGDLKGNNLSQLQKNVEASMGGPSTNTAPAQPEGPGKKLQVDEFVLTGAKVTVQSSLFGGKTVSLTLPEIRLTGLGTGPDGITAGALADAVMNQVNQQTAKAIASELGRAGVEVIGAAGETAKGAVENAKKTAQGVTDLFKKKK